MALRSRRPARQPRASAARLRGRRGGHAAGEHQRSDGDGEHRAGGARLLVRRRTRLGLLLGHRALAARRTLRVLLLFRLARSATRSTNRAAYEYCTRTRAGGAHSRAAPEPRTADAGAQRVQHVAPREARCRRR